MIKTFSGSITDAETGEGVQGVHVWPLATRTGGVMTDQDGVFHLAVDDQGSDYYRSWAIDKDGYGGAVIDGAKFLDGIDYTIYNTNAPVSVKAKAIIRNSLIGFLIIVIAVSGLIHLSKRFI